MEPNRFREDYHDANVPDRGTGELPQDGRTAGNAGRGRRPADKPDVCPPEAGTIRQDTITAAAGIIGRENAHERSRRDPSWGSPIAASILALLARTADAGLQS